MFTCHTYYSLRYGTLSPEQLVMQAKEHGIEQLALADINNTTAMPEFVRLCHRHGIKPIAGIEFRKKHQLLYIVLARNPEGFANMNRFLSDHNTGGIPLPDRYPVCENTLVIYPFDRLPHDPGRQGYRHPENAEEGSHVFTGIRPHELSRLLTSPLRHDPGHLLALLPVTFGSTSDYELHRYLRAIDHNIVLSRLQNHQTAHPRELLLCRDTVSDLYGCFPELPTKTERLFEQCEMDFDFKTPKNKKTFTGHPSDDRALLHKLAIDGVEYRYGKNNREALKRVLHELDIIDKLGFSSYFLITWDIIRYSMSRGFYHVGRGSGANSIVAYCLRITNVDPIELDLYFERFINPKRSTPPDFDIDYSWKDRDQVLDYIFKRYGHKHTALLGTISTFRNRSMTRELGKVLGLPKAEIDTLVRQHETGQGTDGPGRKVRELSSRLADFPNMRSIHAGGVLISEKPIWCYSALDMPPKGLPVVQWDMYVAEELSFEKIDILSQRGIGHINDCALLVRQNRGITIDVHQLERFKTDGKVKRLLQSGETTGCFYVESPAMRGLLKKLRCDNYISLVAASSIIRPGVSRSGMMRTYIERFHHPEKIEYLHPVMEQQLRETYGVMVYQEDVIKVCHHFAGMDLADADVLRRAMSGKYRSKKEMQRIVDRFFTNSRKKGHPEGLIKEVWRQIESFAGYSFSKAHSASFAVESYQSLFLKAHYPLEFMTAVINNFGGFYRSEIYFNEAQRLGANIELPCVNNSQLTTSIKGHNIYTGFIHIQNLEQKFAERVCMVREQGGQYVSLDNFTERTGAPLEQLLLLIRINAFRFTGVPKAKLMWTAHLLTARKPCTNPGLFSIAANKFTLPHPETNPVQEAYDEMELLGYCVSVSPFDLLQTPFRGEIMASDMLNYRGKTLRMLGRLVAVKYVRTIKKELMYFGCFLDHTGNFFDTVHFPEACKAYPFRGNGIYLLKGTISEEFGFPSLTTEKMARLPLKPDPRS